jgi:hypothetical protein
VADAGTDLGRHARRLERDVFERSFGLPPDAHGRHYDPYDARSTFFVVVDRDSDAVVGSLRIVRPGTGPLCTVADLQRGWGMSTEQIERPDPGTRLALETTWDIATLAVAPGHRRGTVSRALYQALCMVAGRAGITGFISILDVVVHRMFRRQYRDVLRRYAVDARLFDGSLSVPVWCDLEAYQQRLRADAPELFRLLFEGAPCGGEVAEPDWDALTRAVSARWAPVPA